MVMDLWRPWPGHQFKDGGISFVTTDDQSAFAELSRKADLRLVRSGDASSIKIMIWTMMKIRMTMAIANPSRMENSQPLVKTPVMAMTAKPWMMPVIWALQKMAMRR